MSRNGIIDEIKRIKKEKGAIILAHNYQIPEVQEIADIVGDSLALSKAAAKVENDLIVFCGVDFMAETAKILSPNKKVILSVSHAACPMADMVTGDDLSKYKKDNPYRTIVCYVNTSAEVKAECDITCTSSNAIKVIESIDSDKILFVPDKNLGNYIKNMVQNKDIELWSGFCITHHRVEEEDVLKVKNMHPEAKLLIHPECNKDVIKHADFIGSTSQIINYATESNDKEFIIGTEYGVMHKLKKDNSDKEFYSLASDFICYNMKKTGLEDVLHALKYEETEIVVEEEIRKKALKSLKRMLEVS